MRRTIARGNEQLLRLESAIATLKSRPAAEQSRKEHLLATLERERAALMSASARLRLRLHALAQATDHAD